MINAPQEDDRVLPLLQTQLLAQDYRTPGHVLARVSAPAHVVDLAVGVACGLGPAPVHPACCSQAAAPSGPQYSEPRHLVHSP